MTNSHHFRRTRGVAALAASSLALLALVGCSSGAASDGSDGAEGAEGATVGFSAGVLDNPFTAGLVQAVVDQANSGGLNMLPATNAEGDPAKQITDFQSLISQDVKGIVFIPRDSDAIIPAVEQANAAGIPLVTVDTAANGGDIYMQVRADNVQMGYSGCLALGEQLSGKGTVLEMGGALSTSAGADRTDGFNDCMKKEFPGIKVVSQDAGWDTPKSAEIAQAVLSTEDIDGVFLASDSTYLTSVRTVMEGIGIWHPAGESEHVPFVTIDGSKESLEGIRTGHIDAVISQPVDKYGELGVQYLKDALEGIEYEVGPTDHDSEIVEYKGNLADMLPSPTVTKENVDDEGLWGNF